jgi:hypothetical protein
MDILVYVLATKEHGLGHIYRSRAFIKRARELGHNVLEMSNLLDASILKVNPNASIESALGIGLLVRKFDWIVIDVPNQVPDAAIEVVHRAGAKVALLNGVGRTWEEAADISWIQDRPERVIIRDEFVTKRWLGGNMWFCWGGAADMMGLLPKFAETRLPGWLVRSELGPEVSGENGYQVVVSEPKENMLSYMMGCKGACIAMGMIAWELAALGVPTYAFSRSPEHLEFAKKMESMGLLNAWPSVEGVEVPDRYAMLQFLHSGSGPSGRAPDGLGADRLIDAMEKCR